MPALLVTLEMLARSCLYSLLFFGCLDLLGSNISALAYYLPEDYNLSFRALIWWCVGESLNLHMVVIRVCFTVQVISFYYKVDTVCQLLLSWHHFLYGIWLFEMLAGLIILERVMWDTYGKRPFAVKFGALVRSVSVGISYFLYLDH